MNLILTMVILVEVMLYGYAIYRARQGSAFWQGFCNPFNWRKSP